MSDNTLSGPERAVFELLHLSYDFAQLDDQKRSREANILALRAAQLADVPTIRVMEIAKLIP